jgi:hypothetical protein
MGQDGPVFLDLVQDSYQGSLGGYIDSPGPVLGGTRGCFGMALGLF